MNNIPLCVYTTFCCPFIRWWRFRLLYFLAIMNNTTMNIHIHVLYEYVFNSLGFILMNELVATLCLTIWETANGFLEQLHHFTFLPATCACSNFFKSWPGVFQIYLALSVYFILAMLMGMKRYLIVILIYLSLEINRVSFHLLTSHLCILF